MKNKFLIRIISAVMVFCCSMNVMIYADAIDTATEITDITAEEGVISWSSFGGQYNGANIYKLENDNSLTLAGSTDGYSYNYADNGNYIVRARTADGESRGKIITLSEEEIFTVVIEDYKINADSASCRIRVKNNASSVRAGVIAVSTIRSSGDTDNRICNKITLLSGGERTVRVSVPVRANAVGIEAVVWDSDISKNVLSNSVSQIIEDEKALLAAEDLRAKSAELEKLIDRCEQEGISTDYETINYSVIKRFADYIVEDYNNDDLDRLDYTYNACIELYNSAKSSLNQYLSNEKESKPVPQYITGKASVDGQAMISNTSFNGEIAERPVFYVGYGHFEQVRKDIPELNNFGVNAIQQEIGLSDTMSKPWICEINNDPVCSAERSADVYASRQHSLKITYSSELEGNHFISIRQKVAVRPGKTYLLTGKVKAENAGLAWVSANNYDERHHFGYTDGKTQTSYDWKDFSVKYTAPDGVTDTTVRIVVESETDALYLDSLSFTDSETGAELLRGGDFENYGTYLDYEFDPLLGSVQNITKMLADAEEHNIAVSLLISPHYFIDEVIKGAGIAYSDHAFLKYNVNAPAARELVEKYIRGLIPLIKDYKSLHNICISNEPNFNTKNLPEYYTEFWQNWLLSKYSTISALNKIWNSEYGSFNEIDLTVSTQDKAKYYDYKLFNDETFGSWHKFMADIIKDIAPEIPTHAKVTGYTNSRGSQAVNGTGYEEYYEYLELNGCDFWNCIDDNRQPLVKEMWNDYMLSFKNAPVVNSEDHIITDNSSDMYTKDVAEYVAQDIYQGAIHGRAVSNIWVWERSTNTESSIRDSILYRPDAIARVGYAANDLNRLSYEIKALQNEKAEVGIIYSNANMIYNAKGMNAAYEAYEAVVFNGQKARFILDHNPEAMHDYKLIIVPYVHYIPKTTINELEKFIDNGGQVIVMGENNLNNNNEYGISYSVMEKLAFNVMLSKSNCTKIGYEGTNDEMATPTKEELCSVVRNSLLNAGAYYVKVVDAETNEPVHYIEYNLGTCNGKTIINLANFGETKRVKIFAGDNQISEATELRSGEILTDSFIIDKYHVITLETDISYR